MGEYITMYVTNIGCGSLVQIKGLELVQWQDFVNAVMIMRKSNEYLDQVSYY